MCTDPRIQRWNQPLLWLLWAYHVPGTFRLNVNIKHQIISPYKKLQCSVWSKNILCYPWDSPGWGQYNEICCNSQIQVCVLMFNTKIKGTGGGLFPMAEEQSTCISLIILFVRCRDKGGGWGAAVPIWALMGTVGKLQRANPKPWWESLQLKPITQPSSAQPGRGFANLLMNLGWVLS